MKLLLLAALVVVVPGAATKDLTWAPAVIESSFRQADGGAVRESIYIDAGEWLYHVVQIVNRRGTLNLVDGARVEVAEEGKHLVIRVAGKEHRLKIEERSRGKKGGGVH
jgi:hypothetical protein